MLNVIICDLFFYPRSCGPSGEQKQMLACFVTWVQRMGMRETRDWMEERGEMRGGERWNVGWERGKMKWGGGWDERRGGERRVQVFQEAVDDNKGEMRCPACSPDRLTREHSAKKPESCRCSRPLFCPCFPGARLFSHLGARDLLPAVVTWRAGQRADSATAAQRAGPRAGRSIHGAFVCVYARQPNEYVCVCCGGGVWRK